MEKNLIHSNNQIEKLSTKEIVQILLDEYHEQMRADFNDISPLFQKVCEVHGAAHPELLTAHSLYMQMKDDLSLHLSKEENVLFPLMLEFESGKAIFPREAFNAPTHVLSEEHATELEHSAQLHKITSDFTAPKDACQSYKKLYERLYQFMKNLEDHIRIENQILFARFQTEEKGGGCCGMCGGH